MLAWVALSCNCTQAGAERKTALADALTSYLPRTLEALENGVIDEGMAAKVFEATACASQEVAREVDARLKFENKNSASLRRMVNTLLMRVDPEGYEARRQAKTAARMLEIRHGDHGSSTLFAELPSDRAQAIYAACDRDALERSAKAMSAPWINFEWMRWWSDAWVASAVVNRRRRSSSTSICRP
ncbi:hypothetical protein HUW46_04131 [Amycolatopsis sp. CA-230715]|nr:hypothetical protein HUW46_04131 [Amycolatopsis sp. CA-230715]